MTKNNRGSEFLYFFPTFFLLWHKTLSQNIKYHFSRLFYRNQPFKQGLGVGWWVWFDEGEVVIDFVFNVSYCWICGLYDLVNFSLLQCHIVFHLKFTSYGFFSENIFSFLLFFFFEGWKMSVVCCNCKIFTLPGTIWHRYEYQTNRVVGNGVQNI